MQGAMTEAKENWNNKVSDLKNMSSDEIRKSAVEITQKVRDVSTDYYDDAVGYVRENPVTAAVGLVAFGFFAGALTSWLKKSA